MFGRLGRRRGALATGGIFGGIATVASSIWYLKPEGKFPAAVEVVAPTVTPTLAPPADLLFASASSGVCYALNGTDHGCTIGYSQCELPTDFYASSAYNFDPFLVVLVIIVYCTCLHGAYRLRNALLTPRRHADIRTTIEHIYNGASSFYHLTTIISILAAVAEYSDIFSIPSVPSHAAAILWTLGTALSTLVSAYLSSGKVSEVDGARAKLHWIIKKRDKTTGALVAAIKESKSRYATLVKRLEDSQASADCSQKMLRDRCAKLEGKLKECVTQREKLEVQNTGLQIQLEDLQKQFDTIARCEKMAPQLQTSHVLETINIEPVEEEMVEAGGSDAAKEATTESTPVDETTHVPDGIAAAQTVEKPGESTNSNADHGTIVLSSPISVAGISNLPTTSTIDTANSDQSQSPPAFNFTVAVEPTVDQSSSHSGSGLNMPAKPDFALGSILFPSAPTAPAIATTVTVTDRGDSMQPRPSWGFQSRFRSNPNQKKTSNGKAFQPALIRPNRYRPEHSVLSARNQFHDWPNGNSGLASNLYLNGNSLNAQHDSGKAKVHESASGASLTSSTTATKSSVSILAAPVASLVKSTQPQPPRGPDFAPAIDLNSKVEGGKNPKDRKRAEIKGFCYKAEHGIQSSAQKFHGCEIEPNKAGYALKFDRHGNLISRGTFPAEEPSHSPGDAISRPKMSRTSTSAPNAPSSETLHDRIKSSTPSGGPSYVPKMAEDSAEHRDITRDDSSKGKISKSASSVSAPAATTATDSPVTTLNNSAVSGSSVSSKATQEAASSPSRKEASPPASDHLNRSSVEEIVATQSPNPSAAVPHTADTTSDRTTSPSPAAQPVPDGACYYNTEGVCKHWLKGTCVGDPNNYDAAHEWKKVMPAGVRRFGTDSPKAESKAKGRAKRRKECSECHVHRRETGQDTDEVEAE